MRVKAWGAKLLLPALLVVGLVAAINPGRALSAQAAANPVATENALPGTGAWLINNNARDGGQIKGYASATSVMQGSSIDLYVSVNPPQTFSFNVYRIGWYGGVGGRQLFQSPTLQGVAQPPCPADASTGLIECSWTKSFTLTPDTSWTSGVYVALLTTISGWQNYVIFVVKDGRPAPILYQQSVTTYQAYNNWPNDGLTGKSLYDGQSYGANTIAGSPRAVKVSFDRPYTDMGSGQFFWFEVYMVHWLERNNYDVTYSTDVDTHANGLELKNHKAFLSVAHDEYWSKEMFDATQGARDAGVNLGFFTANAAFWQIRFEASPLGANRRVVCYKNASIDPVQGPTTTVNFRDPLPNRPEQTLEGVQYTSSNSAGFASAVPYVVTNSAHWVYAGTGFKDGDSVPGIVGYEMDRLMPNYAGPPATNQVLLSRSPYTSDGGVADYSNSSIYRTAGGAWVFGAGTIEWSWGLDNGLGHNVADARIQQVTANVLNAFLNGAPVAQSLKVTAPATATAGQAFTTTVAAVNGQGSPATTYTGTVHFTSSDASAVLPADYTFTSADQGTHQFASVALKTAGTQTITVTDTTTSTTTGSATVTVGPAAAASLTLSGLTGASAGTSQTATVTARDVYGNLATGYGGTVAFTSTDTAASLPASYPFVAADAGVHTFSGGVTLRTPGSQSVSVTDTTNATLTSTQTVSITPVVSASSLGVTGLTNATAGTAQTVTVTARDSAGNAVPGYTGTVAFSSTDGQASLPAAYTFVAADNGTHTFLNGVTLRTAGVRTVTATDTANSTATGNQTVTISAGPLASLTLSPGSASITAGGSQGYTATGADQFGNSLGDATAGTVFSIAPDGSCTGATCTATLAGGHTVTGTNAGKTATASLTVTPGPLNQLTISPASATITAGGSQSYTATGTDLYGNSLGNLTGSTAFTMSPNGSCTGATCSATVAGSHVVTGTNAGKTATASLSVTPAAAASLTLTAPTSARTNSAFPATATLRDQYGNVATGYTGTVRLTSSDLVASIGLLGTVPQTYTFTAADAGAHTFSVTLVTIGSQTITVTDTVNGGLTDTKTVNVTLL